jgi:hypothetical protein
LGVLLLVLLALNLVFAFSLATLVWYAGDMLAEEGVRILVDGQPWSMSALEERHFLVLVTAAFAIGLVLMVIVPFGLLLGLGGVALGIIAAAAAAVLAVTLALSPLWVPALLIWLVVRRRPAKTAVGAA